MTELLLLALGASLVNNFVLSNFLGLCPFIGVSRRFEAAAGMALATLFVLTLASGLSFALWQWVLVPLGLEYLRTLVFILLIAGVVQFTEIMVRATSPLAAPAARHLPAADHDQLRRARRGAAERQSPARLARVARLRRERRRRLRTGAVAVHGTARTPRTRPTCRKPSAARPWRW